eukprot:858750-Prymnesium_polylepis.1
MATAGTQKISAKMSRAAQSAVVETWWRRGGRPQAAGRPTPDLQLEPLTIITSPKHVAQQLHGKCDAREARAPEALPDRLEDLQRCVLDAEEGTDVALGV